MIKPEVPTYIEFDTGCTIDVAIAKMLGWMQGPNRLKYMKVTKYGRTLEQMPYMHSLEEPLSELLAELRNGIGQQLMEVAETSGRKLAEVCSAMGEDVAAAAKSRNKDRVIAVLDAKSAAIDTLIFRAAAYSRSIRKELRKRDSSALELDPEFTGEHREISITLDSLDQWARQKHGVSVLEQPETTPLADVPIIPPILEIKNEGRPNEKPWLIADPRDPIADQPWYTPARYYAREEVRADTTLLNKRDSLVSKVAQSLTRGGFLKRGRKKSLTASTIKKAMVNVVLG